MVLLQELDELFLLFVIELSAALNFVIEEVRMDGDLINLLNFWFFRAYFLLMPLL